MFCNLFKEPRSLFHLVEFGPEYVVTTIDIGPVYRYIENERKVTIAYKPAHLDAQFGRRSRSVSLVQRQAVVPGLASRLLVKTYGRRVLGGG